MFHRKSCHVWFPEATSSKDGWFNGPNGSCRKPFNQRACVWKWGQKLSDSKAWSWVAPFLKTCGAIIPVRKNAFQYLQAYHQSDWVRAFTQINWMTIKKNFTLQAEMDDTVKKSGDGIVPHHQLQIHTINPMVNLLNLHRLLNQVTFIFYKSKLAHHNVWCSSMVDSPITPKIILLEGKIGANHWKCWPPKLAVVSLPVE